MRLNKYLAQTTNLSRRAADDAIASGRVLVNGQLPSPGQAIAAGDNVQLDGKQLQLVEQRHLLLLHKPVGYVCSRNGQGSKTVYELLPAQYRHLQTVGRLDKDSSGLLLLTDNGQLAYELTHPKFQKTKVYQLRFGRPLAPRDQAAIAAGVELSDGPSRLQLKPLDQAGLQWEVRMNEGRNRQIRRTFAALGYNVTRLHRTHFGSYQLGDIPPGKFDLKQI